MSQESKRGITEAALMEQVAMYMAALPCPPLPLIVQQEQAEDFPKTCYKNSHDLIASLLLLTMSHGDARLNEERKAKQLELTDRLLQTLGAAKQDIGKAYEAFSEFTSGYICAFANIDVSVSFMPMDHVTEGDCVHKACCSWHRAQEVILYKAALLHASDEDLVTRMNNKENLDPNGDAVTRMNNMRNLEPKGDAVTRMNSKEPNGDAVTRMNNTEPKGDAVTRMNINKEPKGEKQVAMMIERILKTDFSSLSYEELLAKHCRRFSF